MWKKNNMHSGSILVGSLLIVFVVAMVVMTALFRSKEDTLMSVNIESGNSAYQIADMGVEIVMADIIKSGYIKVKQLSGCNNKTSLIEDLNAGYVVELERADGTKINCNSAADIAEVIKIKSTGTDQNKTQRTIVAPIKTHK